MPIPSRRRVLLRRLLVALLVLVGGCRGDTRPQQPKQGPLAEGDHDRTLPFAGTTRTYILHVPPKTRASKPLPLVISFHGGGGHAESQQKYSRLDAVADREGFVTVYPDGSGGIGRRLLTWNAGSCCGPAMRQGVDDVGFVRALVDEVARLVPIDRSRVYATGLSNGAMMAHRLATEAPDLVAAIAPVAGANDVRPHPGSRAVPVMHIHSVDDPRALYTGGLGPPFPFTNHRVMHTPVEELVGRWVDHDGCPKPARIELTRHGAAGSRDEGHSATKLVWGACRDGAEVVLWRLSGAGHVWPGGERDFLVRLLGPGTAVIDANQEMWSFFSRFSLTRTKTAPSKTVEPWARNQPRSVGLVPWNGTAVALTEPPRVLDLTARRAQELTVAGCARVMAVASGARPAVLCRSRSDEWDVEESSGESWRSVGVPSGLQKGKLVFAGGRDGLALLEGHRLHSLGGSGSWVSRNIDPVPDEFPKGTARALIHQGRLLVGYDRGEWGGRLFSIALGSGTWRDEGEQGRFHLPIRDLAVDGQGVLWAVEGLAHLGTHRGALYRKDGESWRLVASSVNAGGGPKGTSGGDWNLSATSFDGLAFDAKGTPYLLTGSLGVVRRGPSGWTHITPDWNEFRYVSGLQIVQGVGLVSTYDSGLLLCDLGTGKLEPLMATQ